MSHIKDRFSFDEIPKFDLENFPYDSTRILGRALLHEFGVELQEHSESYLDHAGRVLDRFRADLIQMFNRDPENRFGHFARLAASADPRDTEVGLLGAPGFMATTMERPMLATLAVLGTVEGKQAGVLDALDVLNLDDDADAYYESQLPSDPDAPQVHSLLTQLAIAATENHR